MKDFKEVIKFCKEKYQISHQDENVFNQLRKIMGFFNKYFYIHYSSTREERVFLINLLDELILWAVDDDNTNNNLRIKQFRKVSLDMIADKYLKSIEDYVSE